MLSEVTLSLECFATVTALVRTGIRMRVLGTHVTIEMAARSKARVALRALEWPLAGVEQMMPTESGALGEALVALTALKRLLTTVDAFVTGQHTLLGKGFGAYGAFVRLLTSVTALMLGQIPTVVCSIGAVFTLKPLRVVAMLLTIVLG